MHRRAWHHTPNSSGWGPHFRHCHHSTPVTVLFKVFLTVAPLPGLLVCLWWPRRSAQACPSCGPSSPTGLFSWPHASWGRSQASPFSSEGLSCWGSLWVTAPLPQCVSSLPGHLLYLANRPRPSSPVIRTTGRPASATTLPVLSLGLEQFLPACHHRMPLPCPGSSEIVR